MIRTAIALLLTICFFTVSAIAEVKLIHHEGLRSIESYKFDKAASSLTKQRLYALAMSDDLKRGWAAGKGKRFLRYDQGTWSAVDLDGIDDSLVIRDVWLDTSGQKGWAVGDKGVILALQENQWRKITSPTDRRINQVAVSDDGSTGIAVGEGGQILFVYQGEWSLWNTGGFVGGEDLQAVWTNEKGDHAWFAGGGLAELSRAGGKFFGTTKELFGSFYGNTRVLIFNDAGTDGWALFDFDQLGRFSDGVWKLGPRTEVGNLLFNAAQRGKDVNHWYAVGDGGWVLTYSDGKLTSAMAKQWPDEAFGPTLYDLAFAADGTEGWIVGDKGNIFSKAVEFFPEPSVPDSQNLTIDNIADGFIVEFSSNLDHKPSVGAFFRDGDKVQTTNFLFDDQPISTVELVEGESRKYRVTYSEKFKALVANEPRVGPTLRYFVDKTQKVYHLTYLVDVN